MYGLSKKWDLLLGGNAVLRIHGRFYEWYHALRGGTAHSWGVWLPPAPSVITAAPILAIFGGLFLHCLDFVNGV
ncbi:hypothetical protein BKA67DRAFT_659036 [Truncatella angustata]|uniref:Uncharacterized protein n=1 Tax=Truncatella angustata TaxID=152316 RepID=A0A9P8ULI9_9PEZI|nr:uncharacterized protein BKA67DRAFT_659036 [Truncatella angustata]KAH6654760.1 hypothetical protein BKA67DRAFT_659036 [Truncatella angustata]